MSFATEARQAAGAEIGRTVLKAAGEWVGPMPGASSDVVTGNQVMALFQCAFAAIYADNLAGAASMQGLGYAVGSMLSQQSPEAQQAFLGQFQHGMNWGLTDARADLKPRGRA